MSKKFRINEEELYKTFIKNRTKINAYLTGNLAVPEFLENISFATRIVNLVFKIKFGEDVNVTEDDTPEEFFNKVAPILVGYWEYLIQNKRSSYDFYRIWVFVAFWLRLKGEDPVKWFERFRKLL